MPDPRPPSELRALAQATGYWDAYRGDGASVPWYWVKPPAGWLMLAYKTYLDQRWPEAFRLHDWLYTPYGALIEATQEEADLALRDEIAVDSTLDAEIVYLAVSTFGGLYFGRSTTGFPVAFTPGNGRNMGEALLNERNGPNMAIKCVMVFQAVTGQFDTRSAPSVGYVNRPHIGGWTESVWANVASASEAQALLFSNNPNGPGLCPTRANLLPSDAAIVGVKLYSGGAGKGMTIGRAFPGAANLSTDIPQMALLCRTMHLSTGIVRRFTLRCIPDSQVEAGEFSPQPFFASRLQAYFQQLGAFQFMAWDPNQPNVEIFSVSAAGLVTLKANSPFALGQIVTLSEVRLPTGQTITDSFVISGIGPTAAQFTVDGWAFGDGVSGRARIYQKGIYTMDPGSTAAVRILTRKIGRPLEQYRGRVSKRR